MPEGDTLHRTAERLRPALAGKRLTAFAAPRLRGDRPRPGVGIEAVRAMGKNLLIDFEGGVTLRTHLRMTGSWHLYRTGERWRQPRHLARAVLETDDGWCAVCFAAPVVETFHRQAALPPPLARLGPDLCEPEVDLDAVLARFAALAEPGAEIGSLLLDQRIAAGVGNVYKSEVCFACGVDPFTPAERVPEDTRRRLYATAHRLLRANLGAGPRQTLGAVSSEADATATASGGRTRIGGGLAVYRRRGQGCRRCGTPVRSRRQGPEARTTYWCPRCQTAPVS
jgi:endonuclease-8